MSKDMSATEMLNLSLRNERSKRSGPVVLEPLTYVKVAAFITPHQREWIKRLPFELHMDGVSASDVVRLALRVLENQAQAGKIDLAQELREQAHRDAKHFPGRRNRGLPA